MNKKLLMIIGGVIVLLLPAIIIAIRIKKSSSIVSPVTGPTVESEVKLTTWEDPAGFSFSYPENIAIDPHEEDKENYAHLELTSPSDSEGKIIIWVKETDYTDIEDWVEEASRDVQVLDTELDGEPAKKIAYSDPQKLVTAAIDIDALVLIEMTPDDQDYWQAVYDQILKSFTFIPLEGEATTAPAPAESSGGIIEEPEEVIE